MPGQVPSHLRGTRTGTKLGMSKICSKAIENLKHEGFVLAQVWSPLQGTGADTKLRTPAMFFKRKVKEP